MSIDTQFTHFTEKSQEVFENVSTKSEARYLQPYNWPNFNGISKVNETTGENRSEYANCDLDGIR